MPKGVYTVTTSHAETYFSAGGQRVFDIFLNGKEVLSKVDAFAFSGANNVYGTFFFQDVPSVDCAITVTLRRVHQNPFINAIRVWGLGAGKLAFGGGCKPGPCRTSKTVTGAIADNSGFLL